MSLGLSQTGQEVLGVSVTLHKSADEVVGVSGAASSEATRAKV